MDSKEVKDYVIEISDTVGDMTDLLLIPATNRTEDDQSFSSFHMYDDI
jgi:hypothetical protein